MGTCKDEMKPAKANKTIDLREQKGFFGKLKRKNAKPETIESKAQTFADHIAISDDKLQYLLTQKLADLKSEPGRETYNQRALAHLETIQFHLDKIIDLAVDYSELEN